MERLTRKFKGKREFYVPSNMFSRAFIEPSKAVFTGVAVELLAEYEDTGYTPLQVRYLAEGCVKLEAENARLREAIKGAEVIANTAKGLVAENARLRRRCEAAVGDLKSTNYDYMNHEDCPCRYCKHGHNSKCSLCDWDKNINAFEWRGPEGESDANDK